ncbi:MAG: FtsX-like permease family protein [Acidimicrobiales bacterium]
MTAARPAPESAAGRDHGQAPARRAVRRWAWRLLRREWRQQLLIVVLVAIAMAATVFGGTLSTDTLTPDDAGFGTAQHMAQLAGAPTNAPALVSRLERIVGSVDVIDNKTEPVPGSVDTFQLRSQNPNGPYGGPLVDLVSGHYPQTPGQVAVTAGVATDFRLSIGDAWQMGGVRRTVTGIVEDGQNLLDDFALVLPGQITTPDTITLLFDGQAARARALGLSVRSPSAPPSNLINPDTIVITLATLGMVLIGMVALGGFTVLAQRRLRAIGMLATQGATDRDVRRVIRANGTAVGVVGAASGVVIGFVAWVVYRPHLEVSAHHLVGVFQLPWAVIGGAAAVAVLACYLAARRPAAAVSRMPIVSALAGRPPAPPRLHRHALPGVVAGVAAFVLLGYAAASGGNGDGRFELIAGFLALGLAVTLLSPFAIGILARVVHGGPVSVRLALRDLERYRARSGSALRAISLAVVVASTVSVAAAARYGNVLDYTGPNLASNQVILYSPNGGGGAGPSGAVQPTAAQGAAMDATEHDIAQILGATKVVPLEATAASLNHNAHGRNFSGPLYVATPQLLNAFGIGQSDIGRNSDILTMRPGLASVSNMQIVWGGCQHSVEPGPKGAEVQGPAFCTPGQTVNRPPMQTVDALPSGTSAPNTVITEHAVDSLHLTTWIAGWLMVTAQAPTSAQLSAVRDAAATSHAQGMSIESKDDAPSGSQVVDWATAIGILLALAILAMTIGLIRSETANDLRTLSATGASGRTRRAITAVTASALALLGGVIGVAGAYLAVIAFFRNSPNGDGLSSLSIVPWANLACIVIGFPLVAFVGGWLLAGREPQAIRQQPLS